MLSDLGYYITASANASMSIHFYVMH